MMMMIKSARHRGLAVFHVVDFPIQYRKYTHVHCTVKLENIYSAISRAIFTDIKAKVQ